MQAALLKMSLYVSLVLLMPGPTNTLLLSSGLKVGVRRTLPLLVAEALGYLVSIAVWGFFLCALAAGRPWLYAAIKLLSSAYILWLAIKMWATSRSPQQLAAGPVGFRDLFVATLTNPKALLFASTLFPLEAFTSAAQYARTAAVFLAVLVPIGIVWASLGKLMSGGRTASTARTRTLLRLASLVLVAFSGLLVYSVLSR
ncbi:LysE family translocator [Trinickia fusca]|uniref:LysE family translocator n=2 Tax=Trinickia fusca TaxID=2419777 RepID=A0A494X1W1_9BURK|nr:LysE family translocator [Trinickia fusca]